MAGDIAGRMAEEGIERAANELRRYTRGGTSVWHSDFCFCFFDGTVPDVSSFATGETDKRRTWRSSADKLQYRRLSLWFSSLLRHGLLIFLAKRGAIAFAQLCSCAVVRVRKNRIQFEMLVTTI